MDNQSLKQELYDKMKFHQEQYAIYASQFKKIKEQEEAYHFYTKQLQRLEEYKTKYKFFLNEDGSTKPIDWSSVESLIVKSETNPNPIHILGFNSSGMEGIAYESGNEFQIMLEDETDAKKYLEQEERRRMFAAKRGK